MGFELTIAWCSWSSLKAFFAPDSAGPGALALWALLFAGLLAGSAALIIGTSAL
jgi:hypothetical protein